MRLCLTFAGVCNMPMLSSNKLYLVTPGLPYKASQRVFVLFCGPGGFFLWRLPPVPPHLPNAKKFLSLFTSKQYNFFFSPHAPCTKHRFLHNVIFFFFFLRLTPGFAQYLLGTRGCDAKRVKRCGCIISFYMVHCLCSRFFSFFVTKHVRLRFISFFLSFLVWRILRFWMAQKGFNFSVACTPFSLFFFFGHACQCYTLFFLL